MRRLATILLMALAFAAPALAADDLAPKSADPADAPAGDYVLDKEHASLTARVSHMGFSHYTLRFDSIDAKYNYDPANPFASQITVTVQANSLDVGDAKISHQFANEFLNASRYPEITFVSAGIERTDPNHGVVAGNLTLNGVTRPISLDVTFNGCGLGPFGFGGYRMGFSATTDIKRSDFGMGKYVPIVSDETKIVISASLEKQ